VGHLDLDVFTVNEMSDDSLAVKKELGLPETASNVARGVVLADIEFSRGAL
jgi:hypothetical protein